MMRKSSLAVLAAAAIGLTASVASAADLPRKAPAYQPPPPPPPFSWTGFYLGVAGGGGWGTVESSVNSICIDNECFTGNNGEFPNGAFSQNQLNGWLFGGTVGYNWQVNPWLVLGIEGDYDWADIHGTTPCGNGILSAEFGFSCNSKVKWTADVTGRIGFAVDKALLYVKGGVVWAKTDHSAGTSFSDFTVATAESDTRTGGLLGAGVEYAFLPNWSAKIEYNFMDFGTKNRTFAVSACEGGDCIPGVSADVGLREVIHTVKVGVNYRFDWGRMGKAPY